MKTFFCIFFFSLLNCFATFEVHEWGSINIVTGTDEVVVGDISDDQSDLPNFVEVWKKQAVIQPIMIEKPIIYLYSDKVKNVRVSVRYPEGIFTQWWPKPNSFSPYPPRKGAKPILKNGMLYWNVTLYPDKKFDSQMPKMDDHPWWNIARDVDAATVKTSRGGTEKFLFYRGAGVFKPTLKVDTDKQGKFLLSNEPGADSKDIYTIDVKEGAQPVIHYYPAIGGDKEKNKVTIKTFDDAAKHLQAQLERRGLFTKEAAGLVKIWKKQMFEKTGQRAMYMMSEADVDKMLPLNITPKPDKQVRVILVRFECLTASTRKQIEEWITQLGSKAYKDRQAAEKKLIETGRVGEAVMRSAFKVAEDPEVKVRLKEILQKITPKNPNP